MCGLSGYFNPKLEIDFSQNLEKMAMLQHHRGPDYTGFFYDKHIGLAHNRLSLLDLSESGNQPFLNEKGVLIYNGEIYNFKLLDEQLDTYSKQSSSDTEVLFQCLLQWGVEKTLSKIEGMFAFAFYDRTDNTLYLCKDRFGIKPLFYGNSTSGDFYFSSELKAITQVWDCIIDPIQNLFSGLGILEKSNHRTAWKNISVLPVGSYLKITSQQAQIIEYFNITDYINENEYSNRNKKSFSENVEEFDHLLNSAVKKMLVADAPMGAFVSGGIDSSLIAYFAKKNQRDDFKLFTANILGRYSEFKDAQLLAKNIQSELYDYPFEKNMALRDWAKVTWHYDSPVVTHFSSIPFSNISKLAHDHNTKAVLTGEGADELFLGYPKLLTRRYDTLLKAPFNILNYLYTKNSKLANYVDSTRGSGGLHNVFDTACQGFNRQITKNAQINRYSFVNPTSIHDHYMSAQMMQEGIRSLLWRNDRMGMMYNIESRFPFLDEDVVKFAMNLPVKFKIGRTSKFYNYKHPFLMDKAIVRRSAETKLPKHLVYKKKNGMPLHALREIKTSPDFLYDSVFADLFTLGKKEINYLVENSSPYHVALIASFEIFAKLFIKNQSISEVDTDINQYLRF